MKRAADRVTWHGSTMHDVAAAAGVSASTVSRALRGHSNVRPETAARVRAVAQELGFSITASASGLASGKVKRISVLLGSPLTDWFSGEILDAIIIVFRAAGYDLLLHRVHGAGERETFFRTIPARGNADALLVASFRLTEAEQLTLQRLQIPLVYLNQKVPGCPGVGIDDVAAEREMVRYLYDLGFRKLVYINAQLEPGFIWSSCDRLEGFEQECDRLGLGKHQRSSLQVPMEQEFEFDLARDLASSEEPVAVVAEHDGIALRVLYGLRAQGVEIPGQVAVVGFDGRDWSRRMGLTTVVQPVKELATAAAEAAVRLARGDANEGDERWLELPTKIRVGTTTEAPSG